MLCGETHRNIHCSNHPLIKLNLSELVLLETPQDQVSKKHACTLSRYQYEAPCHILLPFNGTSMSSTSSLFGEILISETEHKTTTCPLENMNHGILQINFKCFSNVNILRIDGMQNASFALTSE